MPQRKRIPKELRNYFAKIGKKGGKKGGAVRAVRMTAEDRSESAREAVKAPWVKTKKSESPL